MRVRCFIVTQKVCKFCNEEIETDRYAKNQEGEYAHIKCYDEQDYTPEEKEKMQQ